MKLAELKLIEAYEAMANHTKLECGDRHPDGMKSSCIVKYGCCAPLYCDQAVAFAAEHWGIDLDKMYSLDCIEGKTDIRFLDLTHGCLIPPHFRPTCTIHACTIASIGLKPGSPGWTSTYFMLREKIEELEMERYLESRSDR